MPAPTPTSQLTKISGPSPSPPPNSYSPSAATSASFCMYSATRRTSAAASARCIIGSTSRLRQPRFGAKRTMPVASSKAPGRPTPMPASCSPRAAITALACATKRAVCVHTCCGCGLRSGFSSACSTSPSSDTQTTRTHSTAMSTPIKARARTLICSGVDGRPGTAGRLRARLGQPAVLEQLAHQQADRRLRQPAGAGQACPRQARPRAQQAQQHAAVQALDELLVTDGVHARRRPDVTRPAAAPAPCRRAACRE